MDESWKIYKSCAKIIESWSRWWSALGSFGLLCVKWCAVYTLRLKGTFAFLQCFWYADWGILHLIFSSPFSQFIIWIWMVKSMFWCCWRKKSCTTWDILTLQLMGRATTLNWLTGFLNHQQYGILIRWLYQPLRNDKVDEFISPLIWMMKRPFFWYGYSRSFASNWCGKPLNPFALAIMSPYPQMLGWEFQGRPRESSFKVPW